MRRYRCYYSGYDGRFCIAQIKASASYSTVILSKVGYESAVDSCRFLARGMYSSNQSKSQTGNLYVEAFDYD